MGCISCCCVKRKKTEKTEESVETEVECRSGSRMISNTSGIHHTVTSTYDPANMTCSRESAMENFNFPTKRASAYKSARNISKLGTIADTEGGANEEAMATRDIHELHELDLSRDPIPPPRKRVIFVSIAGLSACIETVPPHILSNALFCFKAERSWFFPSNAVEEEQSLDSIRHRINLSDKFLKALADKDADKKVLWMQHETTWSDISKQLVQIEDNFYSENWGSTAYRKPAAQLATRRASLKVMYPKSGKESNIIPIAEEMVISRKQSKESVETKGSNSQYPPCAMLKHQRTVSDSDTWKYVDCYGRLNLRKYLPLKLDAAWWASDAFNREEFQFVDRTQSVDVVLEELKSNALRFAPSMEILFQSNPTLIPMAGFDLDLYVEHHYNADIVRKVELLRRQHKGSSPANAKGSFSSLCPRININATNSVSNLEAVAITPATSNNSQNACSRVPAPLRRLSSIFVQKTLQIDGLNQPSDGKDVKD